VSGLQVIAEPLGGSSLARGALARAPGISPWYADTPRTPDAWRRRAETIRQEFASGDWLGALKGALSASGAAATRLARSARGNGVVVTAGQQPGLFGGPILTWSKALSALALADAIESACGLPAAPVFWAATDDTDYEEARSTLVAVSGGVETLRLPPPARPGAPMSEMPLPDLSALIAQLERAAGSAAHAEMLDRVRAAYVEGATVGGAFVELIRGALEPFGIAVLDASHADTRRAASAILRRALDRAPELQRALAERAAAIAAQGHSPQVAAIDQLSLVFYSHDRQVEKSRVRLSDASRIAADARPEQLSPTVLVRPIVERAIVPTVAYCAGPGEIAYFAQVSAVAEALGVAVPMAVPRWSGTIIEPHIARILARLGFTLDDLRDPHAGEARLARAALPDRVMAALRELEASIDSSMRQLGDAVAAGEPPLLYPTVIDGNRRILEQRLRRLERRLLAAVKRREQETMRELATARGALFPEGKRQERLLNLVPIAARQGPPVFTLVLDRAREHASAIVGFASAEGMTATAIAGSVSERSDDLGVS
jgi:bacillithiol biosynthesis cysteine-adding enzyme BshC